MATKAAAVVRGKNGLVGTIESFEGPDHGEGETIVLRLDDGRRAVIPADLVALQADGSYLLTLSAAEIERLVGAEARGEVVVPVVEEAVAVSKRKVETGRVRVHKTVRTTEQVVDEPLFREEVSVERVPIGRVVEAAVEPRQEGDTLIVPILEEVLVVEKRLMLKEEVRITRRRVEHRSAQTVTLRSEEATLERIESDDRGNMGEARDDS